MNALRTIPLDARRGSPILTGGFGGAVALWSIAYFGRLPGVEATSSVLLVLFLAALFATGVLLGRHSEGSWRTGWLAGAVTGLINLLVLGSLLAEARPVGRLPAAIVWVPGSILVTATLVAAGAVAGARWRRRPAPTDWTHGFAWVAVAAASLLLGAGGLVTSAEAGLAVVDWPNSYGYNMFLYPLSRMTGGIYYEHAHRLLGALVGLTTLVLAGTMQRNEPRASVRRVGWIAVLLVIVQGVMGGLRVTGQWTLSTDEASMRPSLALAMGHGILGQLFFGLLVGLAVVSSRDWRQGSAIGLSGRSTAARVLPVALLSVLIVQLVLGGAQRHFGQWVTAHMAIGLALVAPLAGYLGLSAALAPHSRRRERRVGAALATSTFGQVLLGFGALVVTGAWGGPPAPPRIALVVATSHQWLGAIFLGLAVTLACYRWRSPNPGRDGDSDGPLPDSAVY